MGNYQNAWGEQMQNRMNPQCKDPDLERRQTCNIAPYQQNFVKDVHNFTSRGKWWGPHTPLMNIQAAVK